MLNEGTDVTIQAAATNGAANIIVRDDITKSYGDEATLTLDAMRNITINGNISSTSDKLHVILNADTDGDKIGAVIINADIDTNGGNFTSASGGNVVYQTDDARTKGYGKGSFKEGGIPNPSGYTVGTYFGHVNKDGTADGAKDDRFIKTGGGKITLNGEVAIGLNGGTLTLDSSNASGTKGDITVTGIINSGNSYGTYVYGTTTWDELTAGKVSEYLKNGKVPAYHYQFVNYKKDANGNYVTDENGNYVLDETINEDGTITYNKQSFSGLHYKTDSIDTQNVRFAADGTNGALSNTCVTQAGDGYSSVIVTKGTMTFAQWLQYEFQDTKVEFAKKYIPKSSGFTIKVGTDKNGNTTETVVDSSGNAVSDAALRQYLLEAQQKENLATDETIMINGEKAKDNISDDIKRLLASNWFDSKDLAQGSTGGGSAVEDSYLATITTILENSLTTPNGQQILWAGGMGSGVLHKTGDRNNPYAYYGLPVDPTHSNGMYWVTGPEGKANGGTGTQFYSNVNSDWTAQNYGETIYGYANWDTYAEGRITRHQPDNSAPFLTVGYGTTGKWDDAAMGGSTTVGFVKETNLANSSLNIKAGSGAVSLGGDIGKAKALDTVNIESTGAVTIGADNKDVTNYYHGTIYADHGVYISGGTVSVGGEIHSGTTDKTASESTILTRDDGYKNEKFQLDNVTIQSAGDLTVHGVESDGYTDSDKKLNGGKISLTSTGDKGKITLGAGVDYDGNATAGTLAAASTEKGAVIIDAQGSQGSLVNSTNPKSSAITTGTNGTWQVYVNSPSDYGTSLGSNLISGTNAQWTSKSGANSTVATNRSGYTLTPYSDSSRNKFIFQVTPVITVSGGNYEKTYGDTLAEDTWEKLNVSAAYTAADDGVTPVEVSQFNTNFQEDYVNYIVNGSTKGLSNVTTSTDGAKATATRTLGDETKSDGTYKTADDKQRAFYNINVDYTTGTMGANGYALDKKNGEIEITKREASITGTRTQTYGDTDGAIKSWTEDTKNNIANGSKVSYTTSIKADSDYTKNQGVRNTANAGTYKDSVSFDHLTITDADGNDVDIAANYDLTTTGTIDVAKAKLNINIDDTSATYGSSEWTPYTYKLDKLVNGDTSASITVGDWQNGGIQTDSTDKNVKTKDVGGSYQLTGKFELTGDTAKNYEIGTVNPGKAIVNPKDIYIYAEGNGSTLGDVTWTQITKDDLVNGDKWDNGFPLRVEPGNPISYADKTFGIKGYVNGQPISDGTQIGNYIYHPKGIVHLTFNPIVKPDVWAHSGGYRPRNKIETSLPVFRVEDAKVGQYGTYGVEHDEEGDRLVLSATGMRLPEPDQVPDEERTFTTTLSTETGSGTFKLVYNGVSLKVYPQDKEAEETVRAGDKTKNVSLSEKALYVGYTEMGLDLIDLKGVYIYFN
ncbi:MAG TPA: hypothetical protein OIL76_05515 [Veillonellaceae bacterium]|nr:hypothetical protein [Veillonellaceae bacterium]